MMFPRNFRRQRRSPLAILLIAYIVASLLPSSMPASTLSISLGIRPPLLFAEATDVTWEGNRNVSPEHKAAHDAPRSQKYWDDHGIERPDYAKTDAEIAAERGQKGGGGGLGLLGFVLLLLGISAMASITYACVTGDWDTIMKNPAGSFVVNCINALMEITGIRGHRLGLSSTGATVGNAANDEEARRLARLARFDSPSQKDVLDGMKMN